MIQALNIVAFDIPYPANYGGAIDVFYRIKALNEAGIKVILHCFQYWRKPAKELENVCDKVYYYPRKTGLLTQLHLKPYTVVGRKNATLLENLKKNDYPILFEGLVSCGFLNHPDLKDRIKLFRECNIEHDYYNALGDATTVLWKKLFYKIEAIRLKHFEQVLHNAQHIIALSHSDEAYFEAHYPEAKVHFIPCFHQHDDVCSHASTNNTPFVLYHGNLMLSENEKAAEYLCDNVFSKLHCRCVIAGMNPSRRLRNIISQYRNIELVPNPTETEINQLIEEAHITVLITFQATGMKLKLLNTLFSGRYIVANDKMLVGSGLESLCYVANDAEEQISACQELLKEDFTEADIEMRKAVLNPQYYNKAQAKHLLEIIG